MTTAPVRWTREQRLIAFALYCRTPFGKMHSRNPEIIKLAQLLGRTPGSLAMKLVNFASLDPAITSTGSALFVFKTIHADPNEDPLVRVDPYSWWVDSGLAH